MGREGGDEGGLEGRVSVSVSEERKGRIENVHHYYNYPILLFLTKMNTCIY